MIHYAGYNVVNIFSSSTNIQILRQFFQLVQECQLSAQTVKQQFSVLVLVQTKYSSQLDKNDSYVIHLFLITTIPTNQAVILEPSAPWWSPSTPCLPFLSSFVRESHCFLWGCQMKMKTVQCQVTSGKLEKMVLTLVEIHFNPGKHRVFSMLIKIHGK